jgi:hypothetical protein
MEIEDLALTDQTVVPLVPVEKQWYTPSRAERIAFYTDTDNVGCLWHLEEEDAGLEENIHFMRNWWPYKNCWAITNLDGDVLWFNDTLESNADNKI